MNETREALKKLLLQKRRMLFPHFGNCPFCAFCGGQINERYPADMHEWLIKRNVVQKWPEAQRDLIFVEFNCVLLHHDPCHREYGQSRAMTAILAQKQIGWYGADNILNWLKSLPLTPELAEEFSLTIERFKT